MPRLGFVGLGTMGMPIAGHLVAKGHDLMVWTRTAGKSDQLAARGARVASSAQELGTSCGIVFLCVNRTEDVRELVAALVGATPPSPTFTIVDHSTISPRAAREIHDELAGMGIGFVDAPITGGSLGAQKGQVTIFCGGDESVIAPTLRYMQAYAKRAERVGGPGMGQMMKMANQIAVGGSLLALCESLAFAERAGLDLGQTRELLGGGAAGSWAFENYGPKILAKDWSPGFTVTNQRKDFAYILEAAAGVGAVVPGTRLVDDLLSKLEQEGHGDRTTAALFEVLARGL